MDGGVDGMEGVKGPPADGVEDPGWGWSPSSRPRGGGRRSVVEGESEGGVSASVFNGVLERLLRTERQNEALMGELRQHRLALEENAHSIVEREAQARQAEARLAETERALTEATARAHALQTAQEKAATEAVARQQAEAELATTRRQLEELEATHRRPWWRSLFGRSS